MSCENTRVCCSIRDIRSFFFRNVSQRLYKNNFGHGTKYSRVSKTSHTVFRDKTYHTNSAKTWPEYRKHQFYYCNNDIIFTIPGWNKRILGKIQCVLNKSSMACIQNKRVLKKVRLQVFVQFNQQKLSTFREQRTLNSAPKSMNCI